MCSAGPPCTCQCHGSSSSPGDDHRLLIFATGSKLCGPNRVNFKLVHRGGSGGDDEPADTAVDYMLDMHGHIVSMTLSTDERSAIILYSRQMCAHYTSGMSS